MKTKLIASAFALITIGTVTLMDAAPASAATASAAVTAESSLGLQIRDRRNRRLRTVTRTRIIRLRGRRYRETYRITYLPNGRTRTTVIRRVIIR